MSEPAVPPDDTASSLVRHWIAGPCGGGARRGAIFDPCSGRQLREVLLGSAADAWSAVDAAAKVQPAWALTPPLRRSRVLFRFKELLEREASSLARLISEEHGKTLADSAGEITRGLEVVEFSCGAPQLLKGEFSENVGGGVDSFSVRQPLGIVAGVTPFNFPAMVPLWMFPIALACGNAFVLKPSERDPSASLVLARLLREAGLPDGLFAVVQGDREVVDALLDHPRVAALSFVGSSPVARYVHQRGSAQGKRVQALGSAKNHLVVMPDADPLVAAEAIAGAAYGAAGERCMAISVVVAVGEASADALVARLRERIARLRVGSALDPSSDFGPLVSAAHLARVRGYIDEGVKEGARLVLDGRSLSVPGFEAGFFLGPTLFDGVRPDMRIYREEIFGPVLCVVRVPDYAAAVALINGHELANGVAVFTASGEIARAFASDVEVGMVGVNVALPVPMAFHSFGGWRGSMFGDHAMHGPEGVRFQTRLKTVTQRWPGSLPPGAEFSMPTSR